MEYELAPLFQAVGEALQHNRVALNESDPFNGDHGDHMVQIFRLASQAAVEKRDAELADVMAYAGRLLEQQKHNGSAQVYASGLMQMSEQFHKYDVSLEDLLVYVQGAVVEDPRKQNSSSRGGDVLKALASGLAGWGAVEEGGVPAQDSPLDIGALFEFGIAYMQAKKRGGSRTEILADAAVSVTPLRAVPHRYESGKIAIQALVQAMQSVGTDLPDN